MGMNAYQYFGGLLWLTNNVCDRKLFHATLLFPILCIYCESLQYLYLCLYTSDVCKHCLTCVTNYNTHVYNKTNWLLIIFPIKNPERDEWFPISLPIKIHNFIEKIRKILMFAGVPIISIKYYNVITIGHWHHSTYSQS